MSLTGCNLRSHCLTSSHQETRRAAASGALISPSMIRGFSLNCNNNGLAIVKEAQLTSAAFPNSYWSLFESQQHKLKRCLKKEYSNKPVDDG